MFSTHGSGHHQLLRFSTKGTWVQGCIHDFQSDGGVKEGCLSAIAPSGEKFENEGLKWSFLAHSEPFWVLLYSQKCYSVYDYGYKASHIYQQNPIKTYAVPYIR